MTDEERDSIEEALEDWWPQMKERSRVALSAELKEFDVADVMGLLRTHFRLAERFPKPRDLLPKLLKRHPLSKTASAPKVNETWLEWANRHYEAPDMGIIEMIEIHVSVVCASLVTATPPMPGDYPAGMRVPGDVPSDVYAGGMEGGRRAMGLLCRQQCQDELVRLGRVSDASRKWLDSLFVKYGLPLPPRRFDPARGTFGKVPPKPQVMTSPEAVSALERTAAK